MLEVIAECHALIAAWLLRLAWLLSQPRRQLRERGDEMQRLLRLASEEAARAKREASAVAWIGPVKALILCTLLILPLVAFLIQRSWQQSVEKSLRIERLREQVLEEAWRAETTSSMGHTMYSPPYYLCPVCCRLASVICSGCMAIRYCSMECQSAHWHSGHSQECGHPKIE